MIDHNNADSKEGRFVFYEMYTAIPFKMDIR